MPTTAEATVARQMVAPNAKTFTRVPFCELNNNLFRQVGCHEVYFAGVHGKWVVAFPVRSDGKISRHCAEHNFYPGEIVEVLDHRELGITKGEWADD